MVLENLISEKEKIIQLLEKSCLQKDREYKSLRVEKEGIEKELELL